jgi:hypothetical protein
MPGITIQKKSLIGKVIFERLCNSRPLFDFTVTELANGGKKVTTVCRVAIANITELHVFDMSDPEQKLREKEMISAARHESRKAYDYCADMKTSPVCILLLEECGEPLLIRIASDAKLVEILEGTRKV